MAYFGDKEPILYLSNDKGTKQQIEDGLNRDLTTIADVDKFVEEVESSIKIYSRLNIIVLDTMDKAVRLYLDSISEALVPLHKKGFLTVIEIGLATHVFQDVESLRFGDIVSFLEYTNYQRRKIEIKDLSQKDTEESKAHTIQYRKLLLENESKKEKITKLESKLLDTDKIIEDLNSKIFLLQNKIDTIYTVETENAVKEVEILKENLIEMTRQRDVELEKNKEYETDLNQFRSENVDLKTQIKSYAKMISDNRDSKVVQAQEIQRLKSEIKTEQFEKARILSSRVDAEELFELNKDLINQRKKNNDLMKENDQLKIQNKTKELQMSEYLQDIESLRAGEDDLERLGRTNKIDTVQLNNTSVYYFKISSELPYFHSAVLNLIDLLKSNGKRVHTLILKNDEGLDSKRYSNFPLYPYLSDVKSDDEIFRLFPSHKMFKDVSVYEEKCDILIVMDYIQSNDYYISTKAQYKVCTVVRRLSDMEEYGYKGKPITLGNGSVLDVEYDEKIRESRVPEVKFKLIRDKVDYWLRYGLIDSEITF